MLWDLASTHPALAHKGPQARAKVLKCLDRLSRRARGEPASAGMAEARARDVAERMSRPKPDVGPETFATLLKRVDHASVSELKGLISTAGGTFVGLVEKQELRNRARELIAAKLDTGGDAEEAD